MELILPRPQHRRLKPYFLALIIVMPLLSSGSYPQHSSILLVIRSTRALDIYTHNFTSSDILILDKPAHRGELWKNNPTSKGTRWKRSEMHDWPEHESDRLVKVLKVCTCLSCGLPSESVSGRCWTALQRESYGHIGGRPSEHHTAKEEREKKRGKEIKSRMKEGEKRQFIVD